MIPFSQLPDSMRTDAVKPYYDILSKKSKSLFLKRVMDIIASLLLIVILILPMLVISIAIKFTSKGPVIYKQVRVTTYGKHFKIWKFRTMVVDADKKGELTCSDDDRITKVGKFLRKFRLDELPQIFHVLSGKMSIVGTRPEVPRYVDAYTPEMMATLLMPAGVTSLASIMFKDEAELLEKTTDVDKEYIEVILPQKMEYNLKYIYRFGFRRDLYLIFKTVLEVLK
ncbi:MAG: sugar transferase [Ruminococcaceae bacterium]|nr:sugar transferase [Oscillospiraceae bacterium]